jgi:hypothetical protein
MALCACGTTAATGRDILSRLSAPSLNRSSPGAKPTSALEVTWSARAPISNKASSGRTRTSVERNEDACKTAESANVRLPPVLSEDVSCSSRRLSALSVLLTVKLSDARSLRRQTNALYPEHRHISEPC